MLIDTSHLFQEDKVSFHTQIRKMENAKKCIEVALDSLNIPRKGRKIILKEEQERVRECRLFNGVE